MDKTELESIFAREQKHIINEWQTFLKFPSISADPLYNSNCRDCAEWLLNHLQGIGFDATLLETIASRVEMIPGRQPLTECRVRRALDVRGALRIWTQFHGRLVTPTVFDLHPNQSA